MDGATLTILIVTISTGVAVIGSMCGFAVFFIRRLDNFAREIRAEMRAEFQSVRGEIQSLRAEMRAEFQSVRSDLGARIDQVNPRVDQVNLRADRLIEVSSRPARSVEPTPEQPVAANLGS